MNEFNWTPEQVREQMKIGAGNVLTQINRNWTSNKDKAQYMASLMCTLLRNGLRTMSWESANSANETLRQQLDWGKRITKQTLAKWQHEITPYLIDCGV